MQTSEEPTIDDEIKVLKNELEEMQVELAALKTQLGDNKSELIQEINDALTIIKTKLDQETIDTSTPITEEELGSIKDDLDVIIYAAGDLKIDAPIGTKSILVHNIIDAPTFNIWLI